MILVIIDGRAGNDNQALALARALTKELKMPYIINKAQYNRLSALPNFILSKYPLHLDQIQLDEFLKIDTKIIISAGRLSASLAVYIKNYKKEHIDIFQIMRPNLPAKYFSKILLPEHDNYISTKANVIRIIGALNALPSFDDTHNIMQDMYPKLTKDYIAVMIGGSSKKFDFNKNEALKLLLLLKKIAHNNNLPLIISLSRRTNKDVADLFERQVGKNNILYNPSKVNSDAPNPYPAMIQYAKFIITTGDSISMCSEAASTGIPIYCYAPESFKSTKHRYFLQQLQDLGIIKYLNKDIEHLESFDYIPLKEVERAKNIILEYLSKNQ